MKYLRVHSDVADQLGCSCIHQSALIHCQYLEFITKTLTARVVNVNHFGIDSLKPGCVPEKRGHPASWAHQGNNNSN